jgi:alkanesulfonate monooxygenase SsuD/methylene tetrahydromethanopterin reductase-like flavin-dependent oxidoreductase (luciferase family)
VFLAAAAQRTKKLRLSPLVYILPIHHPVRLAEEICMLDNLSGGRLEYGVGRGASPHEIEALGIEPATAQARYVESYEIIKRYLSSDTLDYKGTFCRRRLRPGTRWRRRSRRYGRPRRR